MIAAKKFYALSIDPDCGYASYGKCLKKKLFGQESYYSLRLTLYFPSSV